MVVVPRTLLLVREHLVRVLDLLEARRGVVGIVLVFVFVERGAGGGGWGEQGKEERGGRGRGERERTGNQSLD